MSYINFLKQKSSIDPDTGMASIPQLNPMLHAHQADMVKWALKRGQGLAHCLKKKQMTTLRELGYDYATCTVDKQNKAQICVLRRAGWGRLAEFNNTKTGGITQLWGRAIIKEKS